MRRAVLIFSVVGLALAAVGCGGSAAVATQCPSVEDVVERFGYPLEQTEPETLLDGQLYECDYVLDPGSVDYLNIMLEATRYPNGDRQWKDAGQLWDHLTTQEGYQPRGSNVLSWRSEMAQDGRHISDGWHVLARSDDVICSVIITGAVPEGITLDEFAERAEGQAKERCGLD